MNSDAEEPGARNLTVCPNCGSTDLIEDEGELFCQECGTVLEENLPDLSAEKAFTPEQRESRERTGRSITFTRPRKGLGTEIGGLGQLSPERRGQYYRLKKWDRRLGAGKERRMQYALGEIQKLASILDLPESVVEESSRLYEKALDEDIVKGRRIENLVAALIYITARDQGVPRTMNEVSIKAEIRKEDLGQAYRHLARNLDLRIVSIDPRDLVPRFSRELGLRAETQTEAMAILSDALETGAGSGRSPESLAASALSLAAERTGEEITRKKIAEELEISTTTLRRGRRNIEESMET